jgi:hypothetical protein
MKKFLLNINWTNALGTLVLTVIGYLLTEGVPTFWGTAWKDFSSNGYKDYGELIKDFLNVPVPFWKVLLAFLAAVFLGLILIYVRRRDVRLKEATRRREEANKRNPNWDQIIGNYTVEELYRILSVERLPVRTIGMDMQGIPTPNHSLIELLGKYHIPLSSGLITNRTSYAYDDAGYGFSILAPKLMMYGLVDKEDETIEPNEYNSFVVSTYGISKNGFKFLACLEKLAYELGKKDNLE